MRRQRFAKGLVAVLVAGVMFGCSGKGGSVSTPPLSVTPHAEMVLVPASSLITCAGRTPDFPGLRENIPVEVRYGGFPLGSVVSLDMCIYSPNPARPTSPWCMGGLKHFNSAGLQEQRSEAFELQCMTSDLEDKPEDGAIHLFFKVTGPTGAVLFESEQLGIYNERIPVGDGTDPRINPCTAWCWAKFPPNRAGG